MRIIKQSTAVNVMVLLTSATDHINGVENLTPNVFISKNCGNFVSISPVVESKGNGWYKIELTSSHTDTVGDLVLHLEDADADPADVLMLVKTYSEEELFTKVKELHTIGGLNDSVPATTTPTGIDAGTIHIDITGDGVTSTTFTRND